MLVTKDGGEQAVVTDFGIARAASAQSRGGRSARRTPVCIVGTPAYMAPEQVRGEEVGPAADIYALGIVLYEMVTGRVPFTGDSAIEVANRRLVEEPPSPRRVVPDLDERWEAVILRCLAREPRRRFARAEEVAEALAGRAPVEKAESIDLTAGAWHTLPAERDPFVGREIESQDLERNLAGERTPGDTGRRRRDGKDEARGPLRMAEARRVAGGSVVLRPDRGAEPERDRIGRRRFTRGPARARRSGRAARSRHRGARALSHDPRQLRAGRRPRARRPSAGGSRGRAKPGSWSRAARGWASSDEQGADGGAAVDRNRECELFVARAQRLRPGLELAGAEAEAVREIVRLVDGMPLAIELAGARMRVMSATQILAQMRKRFSLLTGGGSARHETLVITIDGSWELLKPWEHRRGRSARCSKAGSRSRPRRE